MEAHKQADIEDVTATGDIAARTQSALSFRLAGRVSERLVDVGSHVVKGQDKPSRHDGWRLPPDGWRTLQVPWHISLMRAAAFGLRIPSIKLRKAQQK